MLKVPMNWDGPNNLNTWPALDIKHSWANLVNSGGDRLPKKLGYYLPTNFPSECLIV